MAPVPLFNCDISGGMVHSAKSEDEIGVVSNSPADAFVRDDII